MVSRSVVPQPRPSPRTRGLTEMPRQVVGGGAAERGAILVLDRPGSERPRRPCSPVSWTSCRSSSTQSAEGIDLDVDQAALPGPRPAVAVGAQPRDAELARDIGLGEPLHEIEPGHAPEAARRPPTYAARLCELVPVRGRVGIVWQHSHRIIIQMFRQMILMGAWTGIFRRQFDRSDHARRTDRGGKPWRRACRPARQTAPAERWRRGRRRSHLEGGRQAGGVTAGAGAAGGLSDPVMLTRRAAGEAERGDGAAPGVRRSSPGAVLPIAVGAGVINDLVEVRRRARRHA